MITFKDYNLNLIRDFSHEQFTSHIKLIEDISQHNDFGNLGMEILLENYLNMVHRFQTELQNNDQEFRLSQNEVFLYDLVLEISRLCYKHSCTTSPDSNDWEKEFN